MMRKSVFSIVLGLLVTTGSALAHGVNVEASTEGRMVVLRSSYSSNHPLADASVSIYSPVDPENTWQTGRTDRTGHFAFVPDAEGEWVIVVDDGKGHKKRTTVNYMPEISEGEEVSEEEEKGEVIVAEPVEPPVNGMSNFYKILMGLSLIIGITGLFYGLKARQERKTE